MPQSVRWFRRSWRGIFPFVGFSSQRFMCCPCNLFARFFGLFSVNDFPLQTSADKTFAISSRSIRTSGEALQKLAPNYFKNRIT